MHVPTLILLNIALGTVVSLTLAFAARRYRELYIWAGAMAMYGLGYTLLGLRGQISDALSIVGGNTGLALTMALLGEGIYRFQKRSAPRLRLWLPVALTVACFAWFIDDMEQRLILGGSLVVVQLAILLVPLLEQRRTTIGHGQYVIMLGLAAALVGMCTRIVHVLNGHVPDSLFSQSLAYSLVFFGSLLAMLMIAAGVILMAQERTHEELLTSERQYRRLIESAHEGICILNEGRCSFANQRLAELLGNSVEDLLGVEFIDLVYPDDRPLALARYVAHQYASTDREAFDIRLVTGHAGPLWFRVSGMPIQWHGRPATLAFLSQIHKRKLMEEHVRQLAFHDELTTLPNRRLLLERLQQAIALNRGSGQHVGLLFIDLDRFKSLNDQHGHHAGDQLLTEVARRLRLQVRDSDTVARLGGDEFVVLLQSLHADPGLARAHACEIGRKILQALNTPYRLVGNAGDGPDLIHRCSGSVGIHVSNDPDASVDELLDQADTAMYLAKQAGRGQIRFADQGGPSPAGRQENAGEISPGSP
ncbi:diguanylate cyclase domain-containing protein [Thauera sp. SDU_THAU2]|uniref:diguanylate cyclase domain-containing protein n=1 Tax=Thauera sp. SDU_THAU2 TaxID=3136633 RepID=UPI00311EDCC4